MTSAVRQSLHSSDSHAQKRRSGAVSFGASPSDAKHRAGGEERGSQPEVRHGCGTKPRRLQTTLRKQGRARIDVRGATLHYINQIQIYENHNVFRRLNVTWRQQADATPVEAQKAAGHASLDMTILYTQTEEELEREHVEKIMERLGMTTEKASGEELERMKTQGGVQ
jgi:hypothetical protein